MKCYIYWNIDLRVTSCIKYLVHMNQTGSYAPVWFICTIWTSALSPHCCRDWFIWTSLRIVAGTGSYEPVSALLQGLVHINQSPYCCRDWFIWTSLRIFAGTGSYKPVSTLLQELVHMDQSPHCCRYWFIWTSLRIVAGTGSYEEPVSTLLQGLVHMNQSPHCCRDWFINNWDNLYNKRQIISIINGRICSWILLSTLENFPETFKFFTHSRASSFYLTL